MSWGAPETENQSAWGRGSRKGEEPGAWEVGGAGVACPLMAVEGVQHRDNPLVGTSAGRTKSNCVRI